MFSTKDYSKMTLEELVSEQTERTSQKAKIITALLMGFIVGIAIYSATHKGGFLITCLLLALPFWIGNKHSQNIKNIEAEISRRNNVKNEQ